VLVARNGEVLYEKGFGTTVLPPKAPLTPTTKFRLGSVTKQFTAAAILKLQAEGKLKVEERVCTHLQPCPKTWDEITLHQLLTHTSGIKGLNLSDKDKPHTAKELVAEIGKLPLQFEPGARFLYGDEDYIVLAGVIEQLTGQTYETFLRENFFNPLKMNDTGVTIDNKLLAGLPSSVDFSNHIGAAAIYSTVADLSRWAQQLDIWQRDPKSEYYAMLRPQVTSDIPNLPYGYGLDVGEQFDHRYVGHPGGLVGYGSLAARYPDDGLTIIILSTNTGQEVGAIGEQMAKISLGLK
jgi:CubicO group peptidase (beta-lactamase class C family)